MSSEQPDDIVKRVEAVLFATGKAIDFSEIVRLVKEKEEQKVKAALYSLQQKYEQGESSLVLVEEGEKWKLTVGEQYLPMVKNLVAETEMSKTILETLAVIAYKAPVLQSEVIHVRTNKAYDHIKELEDAGFITKQKHGRTMMIRLTDRFYKYFEVEGKKLKQAFAHINDAEPEQQVGLEVFDEPENSQPKEEPEHLGKLEVVDEPEESPQEQSKTVEDAAPEPEQEMPDREESPAETPVEDETPAEEPEKPEDFNSIDLDSVDKQDQEEDKFLKNDEEVKPMSEEEQTQEEAPQEAPKEEAPKEEAPKEEAPAEAAPEESSEDEGGDEEGGDDEEEKEQ